MDQKLISIFSEESQEIIEALESGLLLLEGNRDPEQVNAVFRAAHTMKGNAGIVGFSAVVDLTHLMESVLDEMRKGNISPDPDTVGILLGSVDALKVMVDSYLQGTTPVPPQEVMAGLTGILRHEPQGAQEPSGGEGVEYGIWGADDSEPADTAADAYRVNIRLRPETFATGTDPLQLLLELDELTQVQHVVCNLDQLPHFEHLNYEDLYLSWDLWLETTEPLSTLENVFIFVQDEAEITITPSDGSVPELEPFQMPPQFQTRPTPAPVSAPEPPPEASAPARRPAAAPKEAPRVVPARKEPPAESASHSSQPPAAMTAKPAAHQASTIRVETDKLDKLVNLVGELVIGVARVNQLAGDDTDSEIAAAVDSLDHISRDLQEQVMRVRMIPVEGTFARFQRVVRDLAAELGKQIRLEMSGTETELDKNVIEQIGDPLKHLIRNSADHGLEPPDERRAKDKDPTGTIWLKAYQQEGKIIIEVSDDGRGIDRQKVLAKAQERGLTSGGSTLSDTEVFGFMFLPGFSTAAKVTEVSGRGVGLDVVKQNIESLRGSVEVHSQMDQGTTFRIKLPLTLAIIDGMRVQVGEEVLTIPVLNIVESIRPKREDLKTVEGRGELISVRGDYLPLVRLYDIFQFKTERTDPTAALVVIIESIGRRFGVLVDDILGEQQAVIKSLEQNYQKVAGVAGATILGDGRVSLILDIHGLENLAFAI